MSDIPQIERQLFILSMLSENRRGFTIDEIIACLQAVGINVSRKTVERDIDYITVNFFVYEEERQGKAIYFANNYSLKHITFTISELISLHFARELANSYSGLGIGVSAVKILDRIITSAPEISRNYIETLRNMVKINVTGIKDDKDLKMDFIDLIKEAIGNKRSIQIEYHSFNKNEISTREIDPYLLEIREGCWHLIGYCHLREKIRNFRVSRIKSLINKDTRFIIPEDFYEGFKRNRFDKLSGEGSIKLKIRFTGEAARYVKEYESSKADKIKEEGDTVIFERTTPLTPDIFKWVLGFGSEAEVIEPEELRNDIIKAVKKLLENYNSYP